MLLPPPPLLLQRLHLECARSLLADDAVTAAVKHAQVRTRRLGPHCIASAPTQLPPPPQMASALDYGGRQLDPAYVASSSSAPSGDSAVALLQPNLLSNGGDARVASLQRPLDRDLVPLARAAALSAASGEEPSDPADVAQVSPPPGGASSLHHTRSAHLCLVCVQVAIGQAARSSDPRHATQLLERAASLLTSALGAVTPDAASSWRRMRAASYAAILDVATDGTQFPVRQASHPPLPPSEREPPPTHGCRLAGRRCGCGIQDAPCHRAGVCRGHCDSRQDDGAGTICPQRPSAQPWERSSGGGGSGAHAVH